MKSNYDDSLCFIGLWFDRLASIDRAYKIFYYPSDCSTEIVDIKSGKVHLRRIKTD
jgi:nucleoside diphosphate kinase